MKYIDEFRDKKSILSLLEEIKKFSSVEASIMEICGTHTHSVSKYGIRGALSKNIRLISGPGCPVCVTHQADIGAIIDFSRNDKTAVIATFGDMIRVPGTFSTLESERALGSDIRVVYSPLAALDIAKENPSKKVLFYSVGFETTAPTVAASIIEAKARNIKNFTVFSLHKLTPPAMKAILDSGDVLVDGFICPGHVTAIIGASAYEFIARDYGSPCVVSGFEPVDVLYSIYMLLRQLYLGEAKIEIEYERVVSMDGNKKAKEIMAAVFEPRGSAWRGLGLIPGSGLKIRPAFAEFDAEQAFGIKAADSSYVEKPGACACADVLKGRITPFECLLFANPCTPEKPMGPCMVSSEGTCAAYYKYERTS